MTARIGIDVGGTYTDAVLISSGQIIKTSKVPTRPDEILETVLEALDAALSSAVSAETTMGSCQGNIESITVSTTLVTNAILQKRLPPAELILLPGSGIKPEALPWPVPYHVLAGELDYRGREVAPLSASEWKMLAARLKSSAQPLAVISGKFSHRSNVLEKQLAAWLKEEIPDLTIALGSEWGQSNFFRRSLTAYLNLAAGGTFAGFREGLTQAVRTRGIQAPVRILKADGGMLPAAQIRPVESIYSGPAASVLGALAQNGPDESYIVVDIGGTTTDIGLVLSGKPLMSAKGAQIGGFLTNVRSLAVQSVPIGGVSVVLPAWADGVPELTLGGYRLGPAYCLGGNAPTPTDALRYLGLIELGSHSRAEEAMAALLPEHRREKKYLRQTAEKILFLVTEQIACAVEKLVEQWKTEPAYKVWQVLHPRRDTQFPLRLSGGGAVGIASALARRMGTTARLTEHAMAANAVGAAMAKPTFSWTLNLDTSLRRYRIEETGEQGNGGVP
jgi:N-methylhydantoinase A/oxoprolinase/acetone carboxylase beta subunit